MKEHYTPPWRWGDVPYAVVLVLCCIALPWLAAQGLN